MRNNMYIIVGLAKNASVEVFNSAYSAFPRIPYFSLK